MKKIIKSFLLSLSFIIISNQSFAIKNETYLICKKENENQKQNLQNFDNKKLKENLHKNFSFYFLNNGKFIETAVKITFDEANFKIFIDSNLTLFVSRNSLVFRQLEQPGCQYTLTVLLIKILLINKS